MEKYSANDLVKIRMMAAQMHQHAQAARDAGYADLFARAAAELEEKARECELHIVGSQRRTG